MSDNANLGNICRIEQTFANLGNQKKLAMVSYVMAGDPDYETSKNLIKQLPSYGVDIIEIGIPFSDPMADGIVIQNAGIRALKNDINLTNIFDIVKEFRQDNNNTPIILMGYYNIIYQYGIDKFASDCLSIGVDGVIMVDLPPEESEKEIVPVFRKYNINLIQLITPTSDEDRIRKITGIASGFLYCVSVNGLTGSKEPIIEQVKRKIDDVRKYSKLPIVVGFGIKSKEQVTAISNFADGVVVGSAICKQIEQNLDNKKQIFVDIEKYISQLVI